MGTQETHGADAQLSRRGLIKGAAVASAVAAVTAFDVPLVRAAGSDIIKVGVIGGGGRGSGAVENNLEAAKKSGHKTELHAIADVFEKGTRNLKNKHKIPNDRVFVGLDAYKQLLASDIDLVIIATPPGFRPSHLQAAVDAGKYIFAEKPVAVDPTGIRSVMETAAKSEEKKMYIVTGAQRRHETNYQRTIDQIHQGAIGEVLHMSVYWNGGGIWFRNREEGMSDTEYQINNWYHHLWTCGDHICEQHIHNLDVAHWVMKGPPISAYGQGGREVRDKIGQPGEIWDNFAIEYEFPNGARMLSFCRHWGNTDENISEFVIGSNGVSNPGGWVQPHGGQKASFKNEESGYVQEHIDLLNAISSGKPINQLREVATSTMMAIMGRMACYTGRKYYWDKAAATAAGQKNYRYTAMESALDTFPKNLDLKGAMEVRQPPVPGFGKMA